MRRCAIRILAPSPSPTFGACGQGLWKTHLDAWEATGFAKEDLVAGHFAIPAGLSVLDEDGN